jgi:alkylation response protein AidB-like acyl-CoA dehydrogenase
MQPRFVQSAPDLPDPYADDATLRSWLDRLLGEDGHAAARQRLKSLAADVTGDLRAAHAEAEARPPVLHRYDAWGARVDRIETADGWQRLRAAAATHGVVGLPYRDHARATWGAGARVVQHALLHVYGPESATFTCPVATADGAAALLARDDVDAAVRGAWLPLLVSDDPDVAITSGQWMTESQGGSDVGRATTFALPAADGSWRLTGEKWFCSAADSAIAIALARPHGHGPGLRSATGESGHSDSRSLAPFLVPRYRADGGTAQGIRLHRLKEKLGTRAVPTAEIGLLDAYAVPLGDPEGGGLARMMTLVVVTRLHNAAAAAAGMRRGLDHARAYARVRHVAGGPLHANPLHRATLGALAVDAQAAFALAAHSFAMLGRVEVDGDEPAGRELRLLAPLAKLATGRLAVASASEYLEAFGGAGYVEDTGIPRLLRDAQVLPIWEGTTNVLSVDVLRAIRRDPLALAAVLERVDVALETAIAHQFTGAVNGLHAARHRLAEALPAIGSGNLAAADEAVVAGSRGLALSLGYAVAAALLVEHAASTGAEAAVAAANLWARSRLSGEDIAVDAHRHYGALVG